jgi:hypothetical protein
LTSRKELLDARTTATTQPRTTPGRLSYATLATLFLAALVLVLEAVEHATGYWQIAAFALGPDLALVYGATAGLQKGQLHPRAVRLYNLVHRYWGPLALAALASFDLIPLGFFVGALAWAFHVSLDRALGYGLRTRDGFQRP